MKRTITAALALGLSLAVSSQVLAAPKPKATPAPTPKPNLLNRLLNPFGQRATPTPAPTPRKPAVKPKKARTNKPATPAPTASMIVVPPPPGPTENGGEPPKLISSEMSGKDLQFFTRSVEAGRIQAYLVKLLETRAASDQIKALGSALATTQEQENRQITRLAAAKGWVVSTEPTSGEKAFGARVEKLEGQAFDKAVMDQVIAMAQQSVSAYEEAAHSEDTEIREFAVQMLPLAQEKLKFAEKMTGAGKEATKLFRSTAPPASPASAAAGSQEEPSPIPPPIIPSKPANK